jgi:energy-coupling factor transporter ATP-binding protein EcfA2
MHFIQLTLENIGPFKGVHQISFDYEPCKLINVVVGANGSGKTTLCKAIAWVLGRNELSLTNWLHRGTSDASVTLVFSISGKTYEVKRSLLKLRGENLQIEIKLKVENKSDENGKLIENPDQFLQDLLPQDLLALVFGSEGETLFREENYRKLTIPEFISWVSQRIDDAEILGQERYISYLASNMRTILNGKHVNAGTNEIVLAVLQLQKFFRDWIMFSDNLPIAWKHLHGESLPWLIDSPVSIMDIDYRNAAAELFSKSESQVVFVSLPIEIGQSTENILSPKIGCVHTLLVGWNQFGGSELTIFGRKICLTRDDKTEFIEIVRCD